MISSLQIKDTSLQIGTLQVDTVYTLNRRKDKTN